MVSLEFWNSPGILKKKGCNNPYSKTQPPPVSLFFWGNILLWPDHIIIRNIKYKKRLTFCLILVMCRIF